MTVIHCPVCDESWAWYIEQFDTMQDYYDFMKEFDLILYDHIDTHRGSM